MLFDKVFWYLNIQRKDFAFPEALLRLYLAEGSRYSLLSKCISLITNFGVRERKYVFIGTKYKSLISGLPRHDVLVVGAFKQGLYSLLYRLPFFSQEKLYKRIVAAYEQRDSLLLQCIKDDLVRTLERTNPKCMVIASDSLPMERLWIDAARSLSIKTICIQHGLFSPGNSSFNDGKFADAMFVFDEYQKEVVGLSSYGKLYVFGYHSDITRYEMNKNGGGDICIFGQPYSQYYHGMEEKYQGYINKLIFVLGKSGVSFVYKPHPSERGASYLVDDKLKNILFKGDINDALKKYDYFVSLTSTALLEASLSGKVSFQIFDAEFGGERLDEYGYSYTILMDDLDTLPEMTSGKLPLLKSTNEMISGPVVERFLSTLDKV